MSWIKINKNTFTAYCKKHNIFNEAKVFVEDGFDGMVDCVMPVNKEAIWSLGKICQGGKYGRYLIYDTEKDSLRGIDISCGCIILTDERFIKLKEQLREKAVMQIL